MEDFLNTFPILCITAVFIPLRDRWRSESRRRTDWWFDKAERRAYGEPPPESLPALKHPNLFSEAAINVIWLSAGFLAVTRVLGWTSEGSVRPTVESMASRIGITVVVVIAARRLLKSRADRPSFDGT